MKQESPKIPRKMLAIMASADELLGLRFLFEEMAADPASDGHELAKRMMKAIHRCCWKHGFRWES